MATGLRFKGTVTVLVDPQLMEARLALSREGDLEYDEGALTRVLSDAGVTEGFDTEELVRLVQGFQRSKEPSTEVVAARGQAPVAPTGETWQWDEFAPLADDKKALAAQAFKKSGPPEVFQVRVEKVKVQKKVPGKAGLFGASADETQTVVEAREVREKVIVDPNPGKVFWVDEGSRVAVVVPPRPGQPGRDLGGKAVAAPTTRGSAFFSGALLTRQKNEVIAGASGFLRVGRNWADLVPFRSHRWAISYSSDKTSAFLDFEPGDPGITPPTSEILLKKLQEDGFDTSRVPSATDLQGILDEALRTRLPLVGRSLVSDRDGTFEIRFSPDRSKAFLEVRKPLGRGAPLVLKDLGTSLRDAQLKGFSFDAVKGALQEFLNSPESELKDFLLATGKPASRGPDLVVVYDVGFLPEADLKSIQASLLANPKYLDSVPDRDQFPSENVEKAAPVREGQPFAHLQPPGGVLGEPGIDVTGKPIPAIPGNEPPLLLLANVRLKGTALESTIDGLLETGTLDGVTVLRVRAHLDAVAAVTRSEDNLQARLTLVQGRGTGRRLDRALVDAALEAAQVRAGILGQKVTEALESAIAGSKVESVLVAEGVPPANDLEHRLVFTQPLRRDAEGRRRFPIKEGELAASYRLPVEGQVDGIDVLGNPIPSADMEIRSLVISSDFEVAPGDPGIQVLKALKSGEVVFDGEGLSIVTQIAVAAVGGKAGNVKFPGEVMVVGAVETGAYVMAGNLKVRGRVGGALLSSDHNIQVADGIHGEGKAVIRAKKHVSVGFVERALVMAVGDVHIGKSALGCTFRVNGKIFQKTSGGGLQGGLTKVRLGLDVMNLGSPSGQATVISFGQDYLVEDQIQAEVKETDKLREAIVQLDALMRKLTSLADRDKLAGAREKKVLLMKMLAKRNLKLINLRDKFELHVPSEIVVRETLFPGVSIESHGRLYEPSSRKTALRLIFNEQTGRIEEHSLD